MNFYYIVAIVTNIFLIIAVVTFLLLYTSIVGQLVLNTMFSIDRIIIVVVGFSSYDRGMI